MITYFLRFLISELENILKFYEYAKKMNIYNKVRDTMDLDTAIKGLPLNGKTTTKVINENVAA